jgi:hypothetical protein
MSMFVTSTNTDEYLHASSLAAGQAGIRQLKTKSIRMQCRVYTTVGVKNKFRNLNIDFPEMWLLVCCTVMVEEQFP